MKLFSKLEYDERQMRDFWIWFKNNQKPDVFQIVKEMGLRLQRICKADDTAVAWYEMGYDASVNRGTITFWADGRLQRAQLKKLTELAPPDVKENWILQVEN